MFKQLGEALKVVRQFLDLLVGVPHYETYVQHRKTCHPGEPIVSREQFFREAQEARYNAKGGKISRCC
ncbi:YbdD/YjiX family protein [Cohnella cholangitidis]|uniref:YbdD/YjiX family protein n=1 Tax=Cohnella cholangitidis TaxID=2598458 RepID=A0A7G5C0U2_9BACL|nr:YbdD/YjiX family protein [Cohnella cholangitidis]QMV42826.1 YbdD/YjiX family protein [Cohnella cholangitidis]